MYATLQTGQRRTVPTAAVEVILILLLGAERLQKDAGLAFALSVFKKTLGVRVLRTAAMFAEELKGEDVRVRRVYIPWGGGPALGHRSALIGGKDSSRLRMRAGINPLATALKGRRLYS